MDSQADMLEKRAKALVKKGKIVRQVAVLPVRQGDAGLQVLLLTSRTTKRFIIPKGWPMKGRKDWQAAEIEARQEAGLVGLIRHDPIGTYTYWKRGRSSFIPVTVTVFRMDVEYERPRYKELGQREKQWLTPEQAASLVDEPNLMSLILALEG